MVHSAQTALLSGPAYCLGCGYALTGLTEARCPECGRGFDPNDSASFLRERLPNAFARLAGRPLGRPTHILMIAVVVIWLGVHAYPGGLFPLEMLALGIGFLLGLWWLVRCALRWIVRYYYGVRVTPRSRGWLLGPGLFVLTLGLTITRVPLRLGWLVSLPAMNRLFEEASGKPVDTKWPDRWIGIYPPTDIVTTATGVRFRVEHTGFLSSHGFEYTTDPRGPQEKRWSLSFHHAGGTWWVWNDAF